MTRNITLRVDEAVLRKARHLAVTRDQSLSQFVAELIASSAGEQEGFAAARRRALKRLRSPLHLGGRALSREQAHER